MTLFEAGILVLVVILVFLQNFRATLVPATTVPVTVIGAFAGYGCARIYRQSLDPVRLLFSQSASWSTMPSSSSKAVSRYIERGMSGHDAAIKAMTRTDGPVLGITLVLMAVFLPAAFLPGLTGKMWLNSPW